MNVLYTAAKPVSTTGDLITIEASSVPSACVRMASRTVCFGSVHPFSPRPRNQGLWNSGLDSIAKLQSNARLFVLMGDFNSTWDHASFRFLLGDRFVDAGEQNGSWFHMTYPANITLFGGRVKVLRADLDALAVPKQPVSFETVEAAVERIVASAPPLTDAQCRRLAALFGGGAQ